MSAQYITYLIMGLMFIAGAGFGVLTLGSYYLRGWEREIEMARRARAQARKTGVYRIRNTAHGACYIGSTTVAFAARWGQHVGDLEAGTHANRDLQRDWQIYGPDAFLFEVVETIKGDEQRIRAREREWIATTMRDNPKCFVYNNPAFGRASYASGASTAPQRSTARRTARR